MEILLVVCSVQAYDLAKKIEAGWDHQYEKAEFHYLVKCSALPEHSEKESLGEAVGKWFARADAMVFVCAAGIAVRCIAPCLVHKSKDPAVLVLDEKGTFCISLLSGHMGGANALAQKVAVLVGAQPVITTATDLEGRFAVDDFARKNHLLIKDWKLAKKISVKILAGEEVGFYSETKPDGEWPENLKAQERQRAQIVISCRRLSLSSETLQLIPRLVTVGIGCKKGTAEEKIKYAVEQCLLERGILSEAVEQVASIDLKRQEEGIVAYCRKAQMPFVTFTAAQLGQVAGEFEESGFVQQVTGVSNVCERSAVAASGGELLCHKKIYNGVTTALAIRKGRLTF